MPDLQLYDNNEVDTFICLVEDWVPVLWMKRTFEWDGLDPLSFTSMLNIESNVKTLKIVIYPILNTHLLLNVC